MPRGRKRKNVFVPQPWIPNSSSEDEHEVPRQHVPQVPHYRGHNGKRNVTSENNSF